MKPLLNFWTFSAPVQLGEWVHYLCRFKHRMREALLQLPLICEISQTTSGFQGSFSQFFWLEALGSLRVWVPCAGQFHAIVPCAKQQRKSKHGTVIPHIHGVPFSWFFYPKVWVILWDLKCPCFPRDSNAGLLLKLAFKQDWENEKRKINMGLFPYTGLQGPLFLILQPEWWV